jgi:hypothetical protein
MAGKRMDSVATGAVSKPARGSLILDGGQQSDRQPQRIDVEATAVIQFVRPDLT